MPRNGSGSASLAEPAFVPNTPISSSAVNNDLSDIADMLTGSLARDGQGGMTAVLPLANTGLSYLTDPNTGMRRTAADTQAISAGGVDAVIITSTAVDLIGLKIAGVTAYPAPTTGIADKAVTLAKLYHPTATSRLLGSDSNAALVITGAAAAAGLIRLSVADTSTFATGQVKTVSDVLGTTEANGTWTITVVDAAHIDLQGSTFINAYVSGGTIGGGVEEITISSGLKLTGAILTAGFAPPAAFKNLSIKVASNTTVTVAADFIATTDGTTFQTTALSATVNLATTGINALDTGTIAAATFYAIHAVVKDDGTTGAVASLSATAPTMPSGYTYKARIGWVKTAAGSAQLMGTWQLGRRAQYILGLAQTTTFPNLGTGGTVGNPSTPTWVAISTSSLVPSTASKINGSVSQFQGTGAVVVVAPNNSYGAQLSINFPPPVFLNGAGNSTATTMFEFVLESSNIYWAASGTLANTAFVWCLGWEDNL